MAGNKTSDPIMTQLHSSLDLDYSMYGRNEFSNFIQDRTAQNDPYVSGFHAIFFTSPELAIHQASPSLAGGSSGASAILAHNTRILGLPSSSGNSSSVYSKQIIETLSGIQPFMPIFTNRAGSFPNTDKVLGTIDYSETWNKYKIILGTTSKDSKIGGTFSLNLYEDHLLTMCKIHDLWTEYIEGSFMGDVVSGGMLLSNDMLDNSARTIDYMSSAYVFTFLPDGETLIHWSKYTGVLPGKTPFGELSGEDGSHEIKGSFPFEYHFAFKEDMRLAILQDFNLVMSNGNLTGTQGNFFTGANVTIPKTISITDKPCIYRAGDDIETGIPLFKMNFPKGTK